MAEDAEKAAASWLAIVDAVAHAVKRGKKVRPDLVLRLLDTAVALSLTGRDMANAVRARVADLK